MKPSNSAPDLITSHITRTPTHSESLNKRLAESGWVDFLRLTAIWVPKTLQWYIAFPMKIEATGVIAVGEIRVDQDATVEEVVARIGSMLEVHNATNV